MSVSLRRLTFAFSLILMTAVAAHAQGLASEPMFHHDVRHTGLSQFNTSANPGSQKWAFATGGADTDGYASPAIGADGTIYVGLYNNFYAVNPDGTQRWALAEPVAETRRRSAPTAPFTSAPPMATSTR